MRITSVEPILFDAGLNQVWCFVRITTDAGITGIGESSTTESFMAAAIVRQLSDVVIGRDPSRIQELWQDLYRMYFNVRGGNLLLCAMSGIEHALWDIKGKVAGLPVYDLLGGAMRESVPVYVNHAFFTGLSPLTEPRGYAERALLAVESGYTAIKIDPYGALRGSATPAELQAVTATVEAVREAIGPDIHLAVDCHARFLLATAIRAGHALEHVDLLFFEEPVPPENIAAMKKVREQVRVPIASGERVYTKWGFQTLLEAQAVEIIQPDIAHCGGIFEARLIAALAEAHYVQLAPHMFYGPVALTAALHLGATIPNILRQERPMPYQAPPQRQALLTTPLELKGGELVVPRGPGLGITLDDEVLAAHRVAL